MEVSLLYGVPTAKMNEQDSGVEIVAWMLDSGPRIYPKCGQRSSTGERSRQGCGLPAVTSYIWLASIERVA